MLYSRSIFNWINRLPDHEIKVRALANVMSLNEDPALVLNTTVNTARRALSAAFTHADAPEGKKFWEMVVSGLPE